MRHTPGPWVAHVSMIDEDSGHEIMLIRSERPMRGIASFEILSPEDEANAKLMAAAPDLLEMARRLLKEDDGGHGDFTIGLIEDAAAAIAKAEGKS